MRKRIQEVPSFFSPLSFSLSIYLSVYLFISLSPLSPFAPTTRAGCTTDVFGDRRGEGISPLGLVTEYLQYEGSPFRRGARKKASPTLYSFTIRNETTSIIAGNGWQVVPRASGSLRCKGLKRMDRSYSREGRFPPSFPSCRDLTQLFALVVLNALLSALR